MSAAEPNLDAPGQDADDLVVVVEMPFVKEASELGSVAAQINDGFEGLDQSRLIESDAGGETGGAQSGEDRQGEPIDFGGRGFGQKDALAVDQEEVVGASGGAAGR
jgi:hypothetical protein